MKKIKAYEISIVDKTYSKIISDETKFYTSDTALELVFKLKETEYTFESAEIVLLNIDDRSLVTRPVVKVLDSFTYELEDDIIAHYGEWRGQVRFEQAGETYVSSPVKFRIENDLSNDRPPQLSDVQSWVSLKRYADSLVDELKKAVLSVDGIEDTFNENETIRQNQFDNAEQSRQTTFETNENVRNETFESNETARQAQELEREKAEGTRQTVFEGNEADRTETFNANEATRQENENERQQAESQRQSTFEANEIERQTTFETDEQERQSAELIRVENENQRVIDHANRSAELAGKADKVVIKNLFSNGDFSNGDVGWMTIAGYNNRFEVVDGIARNIDTSTDNHRSFIYQNSKVPIGHVTYHAFRYKQEGVTSSRVGVMYGLSGAYLQQYYYPTGEGFEVYSGMGVSTGDNRMRLIINNIVAESEYDVYLDYFLMLDLTETFGAGNEPTKEEMDRLIKVTGYIDGEYALNNKEMLIWTLALIRRNKNAIITLGGTI